MRLPGGLPTDWVASACTPGATSIDYNTDWTALPDASKIISFIGDVPGGSDVSSVALKHSVTAASSSSSSPPSYRVRITSSLRFTQALSTSSSSTVAPVPVVLTASFAKEEVAPLAALAVSASDYTGTLTGGSPPGASATVAVSDLDIFDGSPAAVLLNPRVLTAAGRQQLSVRRQIVAAANVQGVLAEPLLNIAPGFAEPTALVGGGSSVRDCFPRATILPQPPAPAMSGDLTIYASAVDGARTLTGGALLQTAAECTDGGEQRCISSIEENLRDEIVRKAAQATAACANPTLVPGSLRGRTTIDLFVNDDVLVPRGVSSTSHALFLCGGDAGGYVGVQVRVNGKLPDGGNPNKKYIEWPLGMLLNPNATNTQVSARLHPLRPSTPSCAHLHPSTSLYTRITLFYTTLYPSTSV